MVSRARDGWRLRELSRGDETDFLELLRVKEFWLSSFYKELNMLMAAKLSTIVVRAVAPPTAATFATAAIAAARRRCRPHLDARRR